ncbi:MAG: hypothetical protein BIFFINMI_02471 [Phycisphaerae bacterium]|nr:hypothetical protein [Phycisphaerae bacterium]
MIYLADLEKDRLMPSTGIMTSAILKQLQSRYLVEGYSVDAEREALQAAIILQVAYSNERRDLDNAVAWGLLAPEEGEDLSQRMAKRYEWAICRYPVAIPVHGQ